MSQIFLEPILYYCESLIKYRSFPVDTEINRYILKNITIASTAQVFDCIMLPFKSCQNSTRNIRCDCATCSYCKISMH